MTGTLVNLAVIMGGLGRAERSRRALHLAPRLAARTVLSRRDIARKLNQLACGVTATGARGLPAEVTSDRLLPARERWALAGRAVGWLRAWRAPGRQRGSCRWTPDPACQLPRPAPEGH
jgi:hypothetical protein